MDTSSRFELRDNCLRWLDHGAWLAEGLYGSRATHRHVIWRLLQDAVEMVDNVPDQEMRWLKAGFRSGGWANIVNTRWDVELVERLRLMTGMKPTDDGEPRTQPQRNDLERALDVMAWLRWCDRGADPQTLRKAAVALARGGDNEIAYRIYSPGRKSPRRQIAYEIKNRTVDAILRGLRETYGIVPGHGLRFEESGYATA